MPNSKILTDYFGKLRCYRCCEFIKEVALSLPGDEEHVYCRKCWDIMAEEAEHKRKGADGGTRYITHTDND